MRYNHTIQFIDEIEESDGMGGTNITQRVTLETQAHVQQLNYFDSQKIGLSKVYRVVLRTPLDIDPSQTVKMGPNFFSLLGLPNSKSKTTFLMSEV